MSPIREAATNPATLAANWAYMGEILDEPLTGSPGAASVTPDTLGDDLTGGIIGYEPRNIRVFDERHQRNIPRLCYRQYVRIQRHC